MYVCSINSAQAQGYEAGALSIRFTHTSFVPTVSPVLPHGTTVQLTFNEPVLDSLFSLYTLTSFEQAYPNAQYFNHPNSEPLGRVYEVRGNFDEEVFKQTLVSHVNPYIDRIYKIGIPFILGSEYTPNDYKLIPIINHSTWHLEKIQAKKAWDITKGNPNIKIGISDINFTLEDANGNEYLHEEFVNKTTMLNNGSYARESSRHGIPVAGMAAADTDNGIGISAIGFNCGLIFHRAFHYPSLMDLALNGADIINCSWISTCHIPNPMDQEVIDMIHDMGVVIIAGAGNADMESDYSPHCGGVSGIAYPASYNHVISVTGVDRFDKYRVSDPYADPPIQSS